MKLKPYQRCLHCGQVYIGSFCPKCGTRSHNIKTETDVKCTVLEKMKKMVHVHNKNDSQHKK